jgi:hypothetical protein
VATDGLIGQYVDGLASFDQPSVSRLSLPHDRDQSSQLAQKARTETVQGPCTCIDIYLRKEFMKTFRRNDPCPCGSGKKYKHCCLKKEETQAASDWRQAVPKALNWLMVKYPEALRQAVDDVFFGSLNEKEYSQLQQHKSFRGIRVNALEWLLAEGNIRVDGHERRVSEILLGQSGLQFLLQSANISSYWRQRP